MYFVQKAECPPFVILGRFANAERVEFEVNGVIDSVSNNGFGNIDFVTNQPVSFRVLIDHDKLEGTDVGFPAGHYRQKESESFANLETVAMRSVPQPDSVAAISVGAKEIFYGFEVDLYNLDGTPFP